MNNVNGGNNQGSSGEARAVENMLLRNGRMAELTNVEFLLPVWGDRYVRKFLEFCLPTLLAPGNIPAIAQKVPCKFVILTSEEDRDYISSHSSFRHLLTICTAEIRLIDHLITGNNYSTPIPLPYTEAVAAAGPSKLDSCFFFLVSDYVVADGSLSNALERINAGASGVVVGNFQVALEDALPWLQEQLDASPISLTLNPRELMRWALSHLHPATVANTVNFPLNHNKHTNRLFWRVDGNTLLGRFFLMHMLCIRPETTDFAIGSSCDYSFIPEMCPSDNVAVITDSDEYLVIEMQPRQHEAMFLRPGPIEVRALGATLSEWTTERHRENSRYSVVFHCEDLPKSLEQTVAEADAFLEAVNRVIKKKSKPHRGHPYWQGAIAAFKDATGKELAFDEWRMVLGLRDPAMSDYWFSDWLMEKAQFAVFSHPPYVRLWHPRWADYRAILNKLEPLLRDPRQRLIMLSDAPTVFTASLADGGRRVVRFRRGPFLDKPAAFYRTLERQFDICLAELSEADMAEADELIDRVAPLVKVGGQILLVVYNQRWKAKEDFSASIGFHASRFMRPSGTPEEIHFVPATRFRMTVMRSIVRIGKLVRSKPWIGIPALLTSGPVFGICMAVANVATFGKTKGKLGARQLATSVLLAFRVCPGDTKDAYKYSAKHLSRQQLRKRAGVTDTAVEPATTSVSERAVLGADPDQITNLISREVKEVPVLSGQGTQAGMPASVALSDGKSLGTLSNVRPSSISDNVVPLDQHAREPQYDRCMELKNELGLTQLGLMTNQVWHDDPRRLGILLARYKFVAKMLSGRFDVGEVGCGDAFGARIVLQEVQKVTVYDFDPVFIEDIRQRYSREWPIASRVHDIIVDPLPREHDGIYSLDVIEHISVQHEHAYLANLRASLTDNGVLIIGTPSLESQAYASPPSKAGHVNCKSGPSLKALMERYFQNVFLFSMNDEVVHTGFYPMAHYLFAICCGKKAYESNRTGEDES